MTDEDIHQRLTNLEDTIAELQQKNTRLENRVETLEQENTTLKKNLEQSRRNQQEQEKHLSDLDDTVEEWNHFKMVVESRLNGITNRLDKNEQTIHENRHHSEQKRAEIAKRLTRLQNALDIDSDELTTDIIDSNAPTLEQFNNLPTEMRQSHPNIDRAASIWEYYSRFAEYTPKGYIVKSTDIKSLLSTAREENLHWSQIHRAMEAFDKNTPPEYDFVETKSGKALIHYHDSTEARLESVINDKTDNE